MFNPKRIVTLGKIFFGIMVVCFVTRVGLATAINSECVSDAEQTKGIVAAVWLYGRPCYVTSMKAALANGSVLVGFTSAVAFLGLRLLAGRRA